MKRCPECFRDYLDETLRFCLDDGSVLLDGPGSADAPSGGFDGPQTAILHETAPPSEEATRAHIHTTERTAVLPRGIAGVSKGRSFDKRLLVAPLALAVIVLGGFAGYLYFSSWGGSQINSIAVLPFENRSESADAEYLSDGLAESLIYRLSQLPELKVSPTSSVIRYKGKGGNLADIARELGVNAVMTGKLVQRGDNLTISIELIDVPNNKLLWGEQYDRRMSDLLATQREIAAEIAQKLQLKLSRVDEARLNQRYTSDPEAYQLYLKGRYHASKFTRDGFDQGVQFFHQALARDPSFALAWDGLAYCYYSNWYIPAKTGRDKGKAAALKALEIDPDLAEAHSSLAIGAAWFEYDWAAAEKSFLRALELNPQLALAHAYYGVALVSLGRNDEAIVHAKKAVELEPLSAEIGSMLSLVYFFAGKYDQAAEQARATIQFEPNFWFAHVFLARSLEKLGDRANAEATLIKALELPGANLDPLYSLGRIYAETGRNAEAEKILDELLANRNAVEMDGYEAAVVYAARGENDRAFEQLNDEFATGGWMLNFAKVDPDLQPLRSDPRFEELLRKINLAD